MNNIEEACKELKDLVILNYKYSNIHRKGYNNAKIIVISIFEIINISVHVDDSVGTVKNMIILEVKNLLKRKKVELEDLKEKINEVESKLILGNYD